MSDFIVCPKCGKETNKFSPCCEHCSLPLAREDLKPLPATDSKSAGTASDVSGVGIDGQGHRLHEALAGESGGLKKCPFCAEEIRFDAIKCRYCGESIKNSAPAPKNRRLPPVVFTVAGVFIAALAALGAAYFLNIFSPGNGYDKSIDTVSSELRRDPVKAAYVKDNVALTGVGTLDETDASSAAPEKYVYGTIKNSGGKRIIKITAMVYYLDKNGRRISEETVYPIRGTKLKPDSLKPNSSKDFQCLIASGIVGWSGRVKVKITDIELVD